MNDPLYDKLRELSWQRKLTAEEEAALRQWLAVHPEAQTEWEAESGLNEALSRVPDAPLPSNFTARVLQAIEREQVAEARVGSRTSFWSRMRWLPRMAVAAVILAAGFFSFEHMRAGRNREQIKAVEVVSMSLPSPEVLKDFDAIQALNPAPSADEDLLTALK